MYFLLIKTKPRNGIFELSLGIYIDCYSPFSFSPNENQLPESSLNKASYP